jgi:hypothetical protein
MGQGIGPSNFLKKLGIRDKKGVYCRHKGLISSQGTNFRGLISS